MTGTLRPPSRLRAALRWVLAIFFAAGGAAHLYAPDKFVMITPSWVPYPRELIWITGALEIAGAIALVSISLRRPAAIALALYAFCVWPANFKHAIEGISLSPIPDSWWYHGPRLAFQPVIIWAALFAGGVIDWPWRKPLKP